MVTNLWRVLWIWIRRKLIGFLQGNSPHLLACSGVTGWRSLLIRRLAVSPQVFIIPHDLLWVISGSLIILSSFCVYFCYFSENLRKIRHPPRKIPKEVFLFSPLHFLYLHRSQTGLHQWSKVLNWATAQKHTGISMCCNLPRLTISFSSGLSHTSGGRQPQLRKGLGKKSMAVLSQIPLTAVHKSARSSTFLRFPSFLSK